MSAPTTRLHWHTYACCCCGDRFEDCRPQNPQRDKGYGTCPKCRAWIQTRPDWVQDLNDGSQPNSMLSPLHA